MESLIAVTGAEGFIGSHLVEALVQDGARVRAMVQYNSFGSWGWLEALPSDVLAQVEVVPGDVRDPGSVAGLMRDAQAVYHLAALIAIPYSYQAPRSYIDTNVTGTLNVLEAARQYATPRVIHTSTSEVYGTARTVPISETHPIHPQSPYAASKAAADHLVSSYALSYDLPVVTLRPFNTYGPRQSARAVISNIIAQLSAGVPTLRLGDMTPTRDFTFVQDTAAAFLAVGRAGAQVLGRTLNAGSGKEISIGDLTEVIAEVMDRPVQIQQEEERLRPSGSEVRRLVCDNQELRNLTGWQPRLALRDGLARTVDWFSHPHNLERYKTGLYNV
ncbi:SDR family NAD(P)-dependent oxidoreductase [Deinococcus marmoris]|uniref:UDP-glucose 4-epimerase n=1 Tax=Deinococcus marmoris TaxID=249408 RepID=A0A1U7NZ80_9DEIO|nr:SDR family NAD(P)-dependent oxidoreductase [Deinococcus marmoris]OLV18231.1 UDP-glucose 4-epimerase [Deinococcus marmoris]